MSKNKDEMFDKEVKTVENAVVEEVYGIDELKDVLVFVVSTTEAMGKALDDGDFDWQDSLHFIKPMTKLPAAIKDIEKIPLELKDYSNEEQAEVKALVEELNMPVEKTEEIIEKSVLIATSLAELIAILKG